MKFLGLVRDPKDLTTKEYVDNADNELRENTEQALSKLDESKVDTEDITSFTESEIQSLWNKYII